MWVNWTHSQLIIMLWSKLRQPVRINEPQSEWTLVWHPLSVFLMLSKLSYFRSTCYCIAFALISEIYSTHRRHHIYWWVNLQMKRTCELPNREAPSWSPSLSDCPVLVHLCLYILFMFPSLSPASWLCEKSPSSRSNLNSTSSINPSHLWPAQPGWGLLLLVPVFTYMIPSYCELLFIPFCACILSSQLALNFQV